MTWNPNPVTWKERLAIAVAPSVWCLLFWAVIYYFTVSIVLEHSLELPDILYNDDTGRAKYRASSRFVKYISGWFAIGWALVGWVPILFVLLNMRFRWFIWEKRP